MNTALWSLIGLLVAAGGWWIKNEKKRERTKLLQKLKDITFKRRMALITNDPIAAAIAESELLELRREYSRVTGKQPPVVPG